MKIYLTDRQMELTGLEPGQIVRSLTEEFEVARIIPYEELYPPEPSQFAHCSHAKWGETWTFAHAFFTRHLIEGVECA